MEIGWDNEYAMVKSTIISHFWHNLSLVEFHADNINLGMRFPKYGIRPTYLVTYTIFM